MSIEPNDGGAAYLGGITTPSKASDDCYPTQIGMSILDFFAGQIAAAMVGATMTASRSGELSIEDFDTAMRSIPSDAYAMATDMMVERAKRQNR